MTTTIQFVTRTKLAELSRQRELLFGEYDAAETMADQAAGIEEVAALFERLKKIRVGHRALHAELPNLDVLLHGATARDGVVDFWRTQLRSELRRGRLRTEIVYLFGVFLGEWGEHDDVRESWQRERQQWHDTLLSQITGENKQPAPPLIILDRLLQELAEHKPLIGTKINKAISDSKSRGFDQYPPLKRIADNPHNPPGVRAEAKRFSADAVLSQQLGDAVGAVTRDPEAWHWPASGVESKAIWTRNKWRLYPALSLVEIAITIAQSEFWTSALDNCYSSVARRLNRLGRLQKLMDLNAPEVIMLNEKRMLKLERERVLLQWYEEIDPWTGKASLREDDPVRGIAYLRAEKQSELRDPHQLGYGYAEGDNAMVRQVHAEVRVLRAAFPNQPLHIVKLDIREYFASVPQETLKRMLQGLGMPQPGLDFVDRFLAVPYRVDQRLMPANRGVPMDQPMSHWLCEWLLRLLERHVHVSARVRIIRQIDDICLLAASKDEAVNGWNAAVEFITDCGLTINEQKCGAITIDGERAQELPSDPPRWGMLELDAEGNWRAHEPTFEKLLQDARHEVDARHAILAKVATYNEHLKFLLSSLGVAMDLGDAHREAIRSAMVRFESSFFADQQSIYDGLRGCIHQRHGQPLDLTPTSWMVWPITAGGLGVRSATILHGQYQIAYNQRCKQRKSPPENRPADWQQGDETWTAFYEDLHTVLEPAPCAESKRMKALVESFIRRGKAISGGKQEGLNQYWRWILSIYGPEILDRLGTFEFLLTELMPLQLIQEKLLHQDQGQV